MEWKIYRFNVKIEGDLEVEKIVGGKVPGGQILEVTFMAISDITSPGKKLELGYVDVAGEDRVLDLAHTPNLHHHHIPGGVWLMAGEAPYGRVTTAEGGDDIYFTCHGKLWPVK